MIKTVIKFDKNLITVLVSNSLKGKSLKVQ
jgi:hypothetical protein